MVSVTFSKSDAFEGRPVDVLLPLTNLFKPESRVGGHHIQPVLLRAYRYDGADPGGWRLYSGGNLCPRSFLVTSIFYRLSKVDWHLRDLWCHSAMDEGFGLPGAQRLSPLGW